MIAAQSSVALFNQLRHQRWPDANVQRIRAAYRVAMTLFAGWMHPSGKPYLAHGVGAASALAAIDQPIDVVAAAVLHGAYLWGDFGWSRVTKGRKRPWLRDAVGEATEALVHGFAVRPWNTDAVAALCAQGARLDGRTRSVVLMRLASDLDNLSDRGIVYCRDAQQRLEGLRGRGPLLIRLAQALEVPQLAQALDAALTDLAEATVPTALAWRLDSVQLVPPASARMRAAASIARMAVASVRRVRQLSGPAAR